VVALGSPPMLAANPLDLKREKVERQGVKEAREMRWEER
jgi:hypothetical protein